MLLLLQMGNSLIQTYTEACSWQKMLQFQISETWNIAGFSSLLHYYNNSKVQSSVWHLQFTSWNKWEQDLALTELIISVLYFH